MTAPNATVLALNALKLAKDALLIASGDPTAAIAALNDIAETLDLLVIALPPVEAPALLPDDRAATDAVVDAMITKLPNP